MGTQPNVRTRPAPGPVETPPPRAEMDEVSAFMSCDHARLEEMVLEMERRVAEQDMDGAREVFRAYELAFQRHLRVEELVLFPVFEARTGMVPGPTAVLRDEHRQMRRAVELMQEGLSLHDPARFKDGVRYLRQILPDHNAKEDRVLYPTTERLLNAQERAALSARIRRE